MTKSSCTYIIDTVPNLDYCEYNDDMTMPLVKSDKNEHAIDESADHHHHHHATVTSNTSIHSVASNTTTKVSTANAHLLKTEVVIPARKKSAIKKKKTSVSKKSKLKKSNTQPEPTGQKYLSRDEVQSNSKEEPEPYYDNSEAQSLVDSEEKSESKDSEDTKKAKGPGCCVITVKVIFFTILFFLVIICSGANERQQQEQKEREIRNKIYTEQVLYQNEGARNKTWVEQVRHENEVVKKEEESYDLIYSNDTKDRQFTPPRSPPPSNSEEIERRQDIGNQKRVEISLEAEKYRNSTWQEKCGFITRKDICIGEFDRIGSSNIRVDLGIVEVKEAIRTCRTAMEVADLSIGTIKESLAFNSNPKFTILSNKLLLERCLRSIAVADVNENGFNSVMAMKRELILAKDRIEESLQE